MERRRRENNAPKSVTILLGFSQSSPRLLVPRPLVLPSFPGSCLFACPYLGAVFTRAPRSPCATGGNALFANECDRTPCIAVEPDSPGGTRPPGSSRLPLASAPGSCLGTPRLKAPLRLPLKAFPRNFPWSGSNLLSQMGRLTAWLLGATLGGGRSHDGWHMCHPRERSVDPSARRDCGRKVDGR